MRKFLILLTILLISCTNAFAAKIPVEVRNYIQEKVPQADIRFDGVIIFPDNTSAFVPFFIFRCKKLKNKRIFSGTSGA